MSACWLVGIIGKLFLKLCHQRRLMATLQVIVLTVLSQQPARYFASGCFLSTINQILVLFGEHLDITKQ